MSKQFIRTDEAPLPIGPYHQAIQTDQLVFISGQIAIDPATGQLVGNNIQEETHQVMKNLKAILAGSGLTFSHVVKTSIFVTDLGHFGTVNEVYGQYFEGEDYPARETVQVSALPKGVQVEISMIASR
jgi:2-iminobutanoate/2-iminopropanoate deaminase